jgi:hypothetical protein
MKTQATHQEIEYPLQGKYMSPNVLSFLEMSLLHDPKRMFSMLSNRVFR